MISGGALGTVFQEIRPVSCFKIGHFIEEMLGGLPSERLVSCILNSTDRCLVLSPSIRVIQFPCAEQCRTS